MLQNNNKKFKAVSVYISSCFKQMKPLLSNALFLLQVIKWFPQCRDS
ncbi:hypothetical Protein YC6258_02743 [Gynuella sunshinyii YC6258]|uniref:Uncharacterized protein n=1 Tax=Gynuella sunshinyii YC6258 TaxID=1445510 RepID=A0A0C5VKI5_9GAMM|nr:hypothetical Protein YC6258_02743 [Gynuella sunshinyii YC6258]